MIVYVGFNKLCFETRVAQIILQLTNLLGPWITIKLELRYKDVIGEGKPGENFSPKKKQ